MTELQYVVCEQKLESDFVFHLPQGGSHYLIVVFKTEAFIEVEGSLIKCPPSSVVVYRPNQYIHYEAVQDGLITDWITFQCDEAFLNDDFLPFGHPFPYDNYYNIHSYIALLAYENIAGYKNRKYTLTQLLHLILFRLHNVAHSSDKCPYREALNTLRDEIYQQPQLEWSLKLMSERMNISTRLLQKLYKESFGISCMNDVIESRLSRAKQLLTYTDLTISEIGEKCGYNNVEHFCRQFHKNTGTTAGEFRKNFSKITKKKIPDGNT